MVPDRPVNRRLRRIAVNKHVIVTRSSGHHGRRSRRFSFMVAALMMFVSAAAAANAGQVDNGRAWIEGEFLNVVTDDYHVRFWKKAAWTIASVKYQGHPLLTHTGAYHSVLKVMNEDGKSTWIGTGHGGEEIQSLELIVDGTPHPFSEEMAPVAGSTFELVKTSMLGPYLHTARVEVGEGGIIEDFDYQMHGEPVDMDRMYAFMHCFNNQTQPWLVGLDDGTEVEGEFLDDNSFTLKKDIRWAMVYAPSMEAGIAYAYPKAYQGHPPLRNAFWNRPNDNKLYLTVLPSQEKDATFNYTVHLKGFTAPQQDWKSAGRAALSNLRDAMTP